MYEKLSMAPLVSSCPNLWPWKLKLPTKFGWSELYSGQALSFGGFYDIAQDSSIATMAMNEGLILDVWSWNVDCRMLQAMKGNIRKLKDQAAIISEQVRKMQSIAASEVK